MELFKVFVFATSFVAAVYCHPMGDHSEFAVGDKAPPALVSH